jgi:hypothetical protein
MAYVGQAMNPWEIPAKLAVEVMQKIWDALGGPDYIITTSSAVYQKVRGRFVLDYKLTSIFRRSNASLTPIETLLAPMVLLSF